MHVTSVPVLALQPEGVGGFPPAGAAAPQCQPGPLLNSLSAVQFASFAATNRTTAGTHGVPRYSRPSGSLTPFRAHDLRATFVTLALGLGKSEAWVTQRTGHMSSVMLSRYKRSAMTAEELHLGWLLPMHKAIPELAKGAKDSSSNGQSSAESSAASESREVTRLS